MSGLVSPRLLPVLIAVMSLPLVGSCSRAPGTTPLVSRALNSGSQRVAKAMALSAAAVAASDRLMPTSSLRDTARACAMGRSRGPHVGAERIRAARAGARGNERTPGDDRPRDASPLYATIVELKETAVSSDARPGWPGRTVRGQLSRRGPELPSSPSK